jgi:hypothetical protein
MPKRKNSPEKKVNTKEQFLKYKFVFQSFIRFTNWESDNILIILDKYARPVILGLLKILYPQMNFWVKIKSEINTMHEPAWPKLHQINLDVRNISESEPPHAADEKMVKSINVYADIKMYYDYFNPRDGDGWKMEIFFHKPDLNDSNIIQFETNSHTIENKISVFIKQEYIYLLKDLEKLLNIIFDKQAKIEEDK